MKKKFLVVLLCVISFICLSSVENVMAVSGCSWFVEGNFVPQGEYKRDDYYLESKTAASPITGATYSILVLNNYDGGNISYKATGSCSDIPVIKLIGKNKITSLEGIGISAGSNIEFIGDGSLFIDAPITFGNQDNGVKFKAIINGVPEETEKDENSQQPEINEDEKYEQDNDTTASEFNFYTIINSTLLGINIILLIILIIKVCKKEK